jgi:hypothetical protein
VGVGRGAGLPRAGAKPWNKGNGGYEFNGVASFRDEAGKEQNQATHRLYTSRNEFMCRKSKRADDSSNGKSGNGL